MSFRAQVFISGCRHIIFWHFLRRAGDKNSFVGKLRLLYLYVFSLRSNLARYDSIRFGAEVSYCAERKLTHLEVKL
jgi:hypothetical protein